MKKVTDKELQEFWEWCGFQYDDDGFMVTFPNGELRHISAEPKFTLDNLFKYAVPKLAHCRLERIEAPYPLVLEGYKGKYAWRITVMGNGRIQDWCDSDPALALYQAIQKAVAHNK